LSRLGRWLRIRDDLADDGPCVSKVRKAPWRMTAGLVVLARATVADAVHGDAQAVDASRMPTLTTMMTLRTMMTMILGGMGMWCIGLRLWAWRRRRRQEREEEVEEEQVCWRGSGLMFIHEMRWEMEIGDGKCVCRCRRRRRKKKRRSRAERKEESGGAGDGDGRTAKERAVVITDWYDISEEKVEMAIQTEEGRVDNDEATTTEVQEAEGTPVRTPSRRRARRGRGEGTPGENTSEKLGKKKGEEREWEGDVRKHLGFEEVCGPGGLGEEEMKT